MLSDMLAAGVTDRLVIRFGQDGTRRSTASLWEDADHSESWFQSRSCPVGMFILNSETSVAALLGGLRAGAHLVSLPIPTRTTDLDMYFHQLRQICAADTIEHLVVDDEWAPLLEPVGVPVSTTRDLISHPTTSTATFAGGTFTQFTSGTTQSPRGIRLTFDALASNVQAIAAALDITPDDVACSWLPMCHDMGLVGMFLTAWCGARTLAEVADMHKDFLWLSAPEQFLRRPTTWLDYCSSIGATITAAPDFALRVASRQRAAHDPKLDLSRMRALITGGEPVRATTLSAFTDAFADARLQPEALCPAYGLAEATLAVTMVRPTDHWRTLDEDRMPPTWDSMDSTGGTRDLVSSGIPIPGTSVTIASGIVGPIEISSRSLLTRYSSEPDTTVRASFVTEDHGILVDGELYVLGRADDLYKVNGCAVYAHEIEGALDEVTAIRAGSAVAVLDGDAGLILIAERDSSAAGHETLRGVRGAVLNACGVAPEEIVLCAPGSIRKTSSGKKQRRATLQAVRDGRVEVVEHAR